jgi:catechol 2,3-dioxygenase-like lactoylglutathione lyase family enzyme
MLRRLIARSTLPLTLLVAAALAALALAPVPAQPQAAPAVQAVGAIGMTVGDLERSVAFYTTVLGFERLGEVEVTGPAHERLQGVFGLRTRTARLRLGEEILELTEYLAPRGRPFPADTRSHDRWFQHVAIIVNDMDAAYAWLRRHRVTHASPGPQRLPDWNPNAGGIEAFYFRDPDGHFLEILRFPPGKGAARWHRPSDRVFLGIDHTAIVVGDTEASLRFYRDALGLRVAGESENHGIEQERLNSVFGARLRITTLKAAAGPALELLEYLAPRDGRSRPADFRANDLVHWQTTLLARDPGVVERGARGAGGTLVSPGVVMLPPADLGFPSAVLLRDPDGHALRVVQGTTP